MRMLLRLNKYHLIFLAVLSGLILSAAWPARGWAGLSFVALVPLFLVDYFVSKNPKRFSRGAMVLYSYITFIVFNLLTTWWVINSTIIGALLAFILNSFFMALVYGLFHIIRNQVFRNKFGYFSLVFFWIAYEYLHMHWNLSWSWLVIGNVFSTTHQWVQWYEYTGAFGGSAWVILVNVLWFFALIEYLEKKKFSIGFFKNTTAACLLILVPIFFSYYEYNHYQEKGEIAEVVIVQPNVDPYEEQYDLPPEILVENLLELAAREVSHNTQLLVGPESALPRKKWEDKFDRYDVIDSIQEFVGHYPNLAMLIGASTYARAVEDEPLMTGARAFLDDSNSYYYAFNTALMFTSQGEIQTYHKSVLVPGVEQMPFPTLMKPLEKFAINLGGTTGSLGKSRTQHTLDNASQNINVASVICYESIYGEFVGNFVRNKSNLLAIITNDAWWGNTPGYKQHFEYARLRAIEYRRDVVRSANTGKSAFFNQRGDASQTTNYMETMVIKQDVHLNTEMTYYASMGDYIANISLFISSLLILVFISVSLRGKRN